MDKRNFRKWAEEQMKIFKELLEPIKEVSPIEYESAVAEYFRELNLWIKAYEGEEMTNAEINEILDRKKFTEEFIEKWKRGDLGLTFPPLSLMGMKHKKEVDEFYRKLALNEGNKAFWEAIELKTRIIMPGEERGKKQRGHPVTPLQPITMTLWILRRGKY